MDLITILELTLVVVSIFFALLRICLAVIAYRRTDRDYVIIPPTTTKNEAGVPPPTPTTIAKEPNPLCPTIPIGSRHPTRTTS